MSTHSAGVFFDEPTPLIPPVIPSAMPRKITRAKTSMTCPDCELVQSVALDCAGCGRIMKPSMDFRLADPLLAPPMPALDSLEPVEVPGLVEDRAGGESERSFMIYDFDQELSEGTPWFKMLLSLLLCGVAWDLNDRLVGIENAGRAAADLPAWLVWIHGSLGREGMVMAVVVIAAMLMVVSARQVLSDS